MLEILEKQASHFIKKKNISKISLSNAVDQLYINIFK